MLAVGAWGVVPAAAGPQSILGQPLTCMKLASSCGGALLAGALAAPAGAWAQEIPRGFDLLVEAGQGLSHPQGGPGLYLATLQVVPQWTLVPERLRAGLVLGAVYPGTHFGGLAGGRVTVKILEGPPFLLAKSFHVNLQGEYLPVVHTEPGTWRQWVGAGIGLETSNLLALAVRVHRDFGAPATYGQLAVAFNLRYKRTLPPSDL